MFEFRIEAINKKFEDIKQEVNNGKLLLFAEWEVEELLIETKELKSFIDVEKHHELNVLIKQLSQYLCDIQCLIENHCSNA